MGDQTPVFDSGGAAHVYGVLMYTPRHGPSGSNAVMLSTAAHSHRFGAPVVVAPSGGALVVSFSAAGQAIAAWLNPAGQPQPPASPYARVMLHGTLGAPVALPSDGTTAVTAIAANGGGGSVGWVPEPVSATPDRVVVATADASGRFSPPSVQADRLVPAARDGAGNPAQGTRRILGELLPRGHSLREPVCRAAGDRGSTPALAHAPDSVSVCAVFWTFRDQEPVGRGAAIAWPLGNKLAIATWRP